jgi:hypothetical protein
MLRRCASLALGASIAIGLIVGPAARSFADVKYLETIVGKYRGPIDRAVTGSLGPSRPSSKEEAAEQQEEDRFNWTMRTSEMAFRTHQKDQAVPIELTVLPAADHWTIELRHSITQFGAPLPSLLTVAVPKSLTPLAPVTVGGLQPGEWAARAIHTDRSVTVWVVEMATQLPPLQYQISLRSVGSDVDFVLWRLDHDGRRASAWSGKLVRQ